MKLLSVVNAKMKLASMGLRFFKRRNTLLFHLICRMNLSGFNGAALFQAQKSHTGPRVIENSPGFNGAALFQAQKCGIAIERDFYPGEASMGLRFFKRRNVRQTPQDAAYRFRLQWGCAFSSAEIGALATEEGIQLVGLQWGCAFSSAEIAAMNYICSLEFRGFNGAALFQAQKFQQIIF